jgi:hypothetical protein
VASRWYDEGGTFTEDAEVAAADGCQGLHDRQQNFCCPVSPDLGGDDVRMGPVQAKNIGAVVGSVKI